jgi:hypothetical protein
MLHSVRKRGPPLALGPPLPRALGNQARVQESRAARTRCGACTCMGRRARPDEQHACAVARSAGSARQRAHRTSYLPTRARSSGRLLALSYGCVCLDLSQYKRRLRRRAFASFDHSKMQSSSSKIAGGCGTNSIRVRAGTENGKSRLWAEDVHREQSLPNAPPAPGCSSAPAARGAGSTLAFGPDLGRFF